LVYFQTVIVPADGIRAANCEERKIRHILVLEAALRLMSTLLVRASYHVGQVAGRPSEGFDSACHRQVYFCFWPITSFSSVSAFPVLEKADVAAALAEPYRMRQSCRGAKSLCQPSKIRLVCLRH